MNEQMEFPETFDEFAEDFGFKDREEIYTNGAELIPVFRVKQWIEHDIQLMNVTDSWIPVSERLPENANHLGAFCPRYMISSAKYGVTEGWYNPDMRTWYGLIWQLTPGNIEMNRGDIPAVMRMIDVTAWMPLPEPYKAESEEK